MRRLFEVDFVMHYHISNPDLVLDEYTCTEEEFDLEESLANPIVAKGSGKAAFVNIQGGVNIFAYDRFICSCKRPQSFARGLKRCDFVISSPQAEETVCLCELTSSNTGSVEGLNKPIPNNKGDIEYEGGKYEKVEDQLSISLQTMMAVPAMAIDMNRRKRKICLMAYRIYEPPTTENPMIRPQTRYQKLETEETKEQGAIVSCPRIEALGFEYRRINHDYAFAL